MEVHLNRDSIVDQRTGEVATPDEFMENLRAIEVGIARADEEIDALKGDLRAVRDRREKLVAQLRAGVREGTVMPLFEQGQEPEAPDNPDAGLDSEDD